MRGGRADRAAAIRHVRWEGCVTTEEAGPVARPRRGRGFAATPRAGAAGCGRSLPAGPRPASDASSAASHRRPAAELKNRQQHDGRQRQQHDRRMAVGNRHIAEKCDHDGDRQRVRKLRQDVVEMAARRRGGGKDRRLGNGRAVMAEDRPANHCRQSSPKARDAWGWPHSNRPAGHV